MNNPVLPINLGEICKFVTDFQDALHPKFWNIVSWFWSWYGLVVFIGLAAWVILEILTRHGNFHYNSDNGFSPTFNRVVGSGAYLLFQAIIYFVFSYFFGEEIYCKPFSYIVHAIVFGLTGLFLYGIGFWVYLGKPKSRRRKIQLLKN